MHDIINLFLFIIKPENLYYYLRLIAVFVSLTFSGIVFFRKIYSKFDTNKLTILGLGMTLGPLTHLFALSVLSYLLKGGIFIVIIYLIQISVSFYLFRNNIHEYKSFFRVALNKSNIIYVLLIATFISTIFLFVGNTVIGGDVMSQWPLASSFVRGNYPTVLPWQPNQLSAYHQGAFMLMGAVVVLTGISIDHVHYFLSFYFLTTLVILISGIVRQKTNSVFGLLPAFFAVILVGPIFILGNTNSFANTLLNIKIGKIDYIRQLAIFPDFNSIKGYIGAGASDIFLLVFLNYILFGLVTFISITYLLLNINSQRQYKKYYFLFGLLILLLSINEAIALVLIPVLLLKFIKDTFKTDQVKNTLKRYLFLLFYCLSLFLLIQNPIRDSFISPAKEAPRFKLVEKSDMAAYENLSEYQFRKKYIGQANTKESEKYGSWYVPNLLIFSLLILLIAYFSKDKFSLILSSSAIISGIAGLTILNTFWPANALRFITQGYHLSMIALSLLLIGFWKSNSIKKKFLSILIVIFFIPSILVSSAKVLNGAFTGSYPFYQGQLNYKDQSLDWISKNINYDQKIIFVDDFPYKTSYSSQTMAATLHYGIFVPTVKPEPKVVNIDYSTEWFDAVTYLSPQAFKILDANYVYIKKESIDRFSDQKIKQINDSEYFSKIYANDSGSLYSVTTKYLNLPESEITISSLLQQVPDNSRVFLDKMSYAEIRRGSILDLSKRTHLISYQSLIGRDNDTFLFIESKLHIDEDLSDQNIQTVEYALLDQKTDPNSVLKGEYNKLSENQFIKLLKKK